MTASGVGQLNRIKLLQVTTTILGATVTDSTCLRAIIRQMRIRGWRPVHLPAPDPLLDGDRPGRSHVWASRDGLQRLRWLGGTLDWHNGNTTLFVCHQTSALQAGLIMEAYQLIRPGVMDNSEWFARPQLATRRSLAAVR